MGSKLKQTRPKSTVKIENSKKLAPQLKNALKKPTERLGSNTSFSNMKASFVTN